MNRKHKGIWREAGKLGRCFVIVLPRKMKAVFPPADKGAALTCILHLSYTRHVINRTRIVLANWCLILKFEMSV